MAITIIVVLAVILGWGILIIHEDDGDGHCISGSVGSFTSGLGKTPSRTVAASSIALGSSSGSGGGGSSGGGRLRGWLVDGLEPCKMPALAGRQADACFAGQGGR